MADSVAPLILLNEVAAMVTVSRSTLWRWIKQGIFPTPIKLGPRRIAWRRSDVNAWLDSRGAA